MDIDIPSALLGGLTPRAFMKRHWQKKPLLIRGACTEGEPGLDRQQLFALAAQDAVESRLVERHGGVDADGGGRWTLRHGPFERRRLPPLSRAAWTLLVQGVDLHSDAAHALLRRFRFVPDARLDDLMLSFATDGGGVGPHVDSYDVFLLQVRGRRRWRIGRPGDASLMPDAPLKILARFEPEQEWLLEAGDMLYLPPRWAHEGVAVGECITASIGFRAPSRSDVGVQVLQRLLDAASDAAAEAPGPLYRDPAQPAAVQSASIPPPLAGFAADAVQRLLAEPHALQRALGEWLSEPKPTVFYDEPAVLQRGAGLRLDRRTRMLYDDRHVFVNGDSFIAGGRDAALLQRLADERELTASEVSTFSKPAWTLMQDWAAEGWLLSTSPAPLAARHAK